MGEFGAFMTLQEAAAKIGTTANALYLHIRKHGIPVKHAGRTIMVRLEDLSDVRVPLSVVLPYMTQTSRVE